jgi:hypothetical protein
LKKLWMTPRFTRIKPNTYEKHLEESIIILILQKSESEILIEKLRAEIAALEAEKLELLARLIHYQPVEEDE